MKICLVNSFYPPYIGGAETYVSNLARNLAQDGHEVTVYCSDEPLPAGVSYDGAVKVARMKTPFTFYGTPLTLFPPSFLTGDWDLIHCNFPNPFFAAMSAVVGEVKGVPAILTWHNDLPRVTGGASFLVGLHEDTSPSYLNSYSQIIATTAAYVRSSRILRKHHRKVVVIPNGVDTERFSPGVNSGSIKDRYHLHGYKTLIFVGVLSKWHSYKGVEILLRAFAMSERQCDNLKLLVVGGGNMMGYYQRMAHQLPGGDRVVFAGQVGEDLPAYYSASDFAVLPSKNSSEGFGLTLLEAMASGKAVIGTNVGGIPDVIEHGRNGLLVPPGDAETLSDAIRVMFLNDELRERLGQSGRAYAEAHDWKEIVRRTVSVYKAARKSARSRPFPW